MKAETKFGFGDKVKCKVTGFKGIVTAMSLWMTNCTTYCVRPKMGKDNKYPEAKWFDEPQLELVEANSVDLFNKPHDSKVGGPMDAPESTMNVD